MRREVISVFVMIIMLTSVSVGSLPMASAEIPGSPMGLKSSGAATKTGISLVWESALFGGTATSYKVYMSTNSGTNFGAYDDGTVINDSPLSTSYSVTGLTAGTEYRFVVQAINSDGASFIDLSNPNGGYGWFETATLPDGAVAYESTQNFADNVKFNDVVDLSSAAQNFGSGNEFADNQSFAGQDHDFSDGGMKFGEGTQFAADETYGASMDFSAGAQNFDGDNVFGAGGTFGASQDFGNDVTRSLLYAALASGGSDLTGIFSIIDKIDASDAASSNTNLVGTVEIIAADPATKKFKTGKNVTVTFSDTTVGQSVQKTMFTDANADGIINCTVSACELAAISGVQFDASTTVEFSQPVTQTFSGSQTFGANTSFNEGQEFTGVQTFGDGASFGAGTVFAKGQTFTGTQTFDGAQTFSEGASFAAGQQFNSTMSTTAKNLAPMSTSSVALHLIFDVFDDNNNGSAVAETSIAATPASDKFITGKIDVAFNNHSSGTAAHKITFTDVNSNGVIDCVAAVTSVPPTGSQCELTDLPSGVTFDATSSVVFTQDEVQSFTGANTFGDAATFSDNQDFSSGTITAGIMELDVAATGLTNWFDIMALITTVDTAGGNTDVTPGDVTVITALNSKLYTTGSTIFADFSAVTSGPQINDVIFTDLNSNGKIDCTGTGASACELADLPSPVTFADASTLIFDLHPVQTFGQGTVFGAGTSFAKGQAFTAPQDFSGGAMVFQPGMAFAPAQDFDNGDIDYDFAKKAMEYGSASDFKAAETFGEAADFDAGVQLFDGANTFGEASKFAASQTFAVPQTFAGANTFGDAMQFAPNQSFDDGLVTAGIMELDVAATGLTNWFDIMALITTVDTAGGNTDVTPGDVTVITGLSSATYVTGGMIFADFSAVTSGPQINDVIFTDLNKNGKIDCTGTGASACELADLTSPVTFADGATLTFDYYKPHTFGQGTVFGAGAEFPKGQAFTAPQDFSAGAMVFQPGMAFAPAQDFDNGDIDYDFAKKAMEYGSASDFKAAETFGEAADFDAGVQLFDGANTFGEASKFAASQTFAVPQTFAGANTFGDAMQFAPNQSFDDGLVTAGTMELDASTGGTVDWFTIMQLIDVVDKNGTPQTGTAGTVTAITALSGGTYVTGGMIFADFSAVTSGPQINDIIFTDANKDGVINCTDTGSNCELADLTSPVVFADGATLTFDYYKPHTFGQGTVFGAGAEFPKGQAFTAPQDFSAGAMVFQPGMAFAPAQDFDNGDIDYDFAKKAMTYGSASDFKANEVFGEAADFDAGVQLFEGANTFGEASKFAASQTFAVPQTFTGANTFGAGTQFPPAQDFSVAGSVTSASIAVATNVAINDMTKQNAAFPTIEASSGVFESGKNVTITFSDVDNPASEDKIQQVLFTDANKNGIIEDGELGAISTVTTSSDTITVTQAKIQDFSAGAQTFGDAVKFAENQAFDDNVQNFGTGTVFTGNAEFHASQVFSPSAVFDDGQEFGAVADPDSAFAATGIIFGDEEPIVFADADLKFGAEATFPKKQDFSAGAANDFSAAEINFKEGTKFHASETFGENVDFEGAITFPDALDVPTGAEFAAQTFANGATPAFDSFNTFADNTIFEDKTINFSTNASFKGDATFESDSTHTFGSGTTFGGAIDMGSGTHVFNGDSIDFGPASDLSGKVQDFAGGATATIPQFGAGTTFADTQSLPTGSVVSTGILLSSVTCGTDTSSGTCLPNADSAILTKGEIITPGETAPPAVKNTISKDNTTVSIDGLGVSVDFTGVSTDGNLSVSIQDPDDTVAATGATLTEDNSGAITFETGSTTIVSVSSIIDFDLTGSTSSTGTTDITLPYDAAAVEAGGFAEGTLEVSHYVDGEWIIERNCSVDTVNDQITCTVDSVE